MPKPVSLTVRRARPPGAADRQLAALGHGVARVQDQVDEHLLQQSAVRANVAETVGQRHDQIDVFADDPAQHSLGADHGRVEVDDAWVEDMLSRKRQ